MNNLDDLIDSMAAGGDDREHVGQKRSLTAQPVRFFNDVLSQNSAIGEIEEHRQRETPTTQEFEDFLANESLKSRKKKASKRAEYNEAVEAALQSGVLTQLTPPSSWEPSSPSSPITPQDSQTSITPDTTEKWQTVMDLMHEEESLVGALQKKGLSLNKQRELVDLMQINLEKQEAIIAEEMDFISAQSNRRSPS